MRRGNMTPEIVAFLKQARVLPANKDAADHKYFRHLMAFEKSGHWQALGEPTYAAFLAALDLTDGHRYERYKRSCERHDETLIAKAGVPAAVAAGKLPADEAESLLERAAHSHELNGAPVSDRQATSMYREHKARAQGATRGAPGSRAKSYSTLLDENTDLRARLDAALEEVKHLKAEKRTLESTVRTLRAELDKLAKPPRTPKSPTKKAGKEAHA